MRFPPLVLKREVSHNKHGGSISIHFSTLLSFFQNEGFIYFSDETARDFFENPGKYDPQLSDEGAYDYIKPYNGHWAYVKLY